MAITRPDWVIQVCFNADPNDPNAVPIWTNITADVMGAQQFTRGRTYELDQSQTAQPTIIIRDVNEYYNPANTASPYAPNIQPYRQIVWQGVWDQATYTNTPAGNLLNTSGWRLNYDPTFESYTAGAAPDPDWSAAIGSATSLIVASAQS